MLRVRGIEAAYGNITALKGIDLDVAEGEIVAILGANGAGKSTLLRTIAGLLHPRAGTVTFRGEEIAGLPADRVVGKGISIVPEGRAILSRMTVAENLEMGGYRRRDGEVRKDIERVMDDFPVLRTRASQLAGSLSGGEQQMLAIARALVARPRLLLLDEPSLGLAPLVVSDIFAIVRRINAAGTTVLLVEQNVRQALRVSRRAYVLETGKVSLSGPSDALVHAPGVVDSYLGRNPQAPRAAPLPPARPPTRETTEDD